ncbi:MAG: glycosyltransferase [Deltaproteobacteria bacterium]|nr:glycosyltransferase [Deltaproteobacteria bacterium]
MAFRKDRLKAIGGFDPQFRVAGDDVDICWRLREQGWTLGFHPAALLWHHRRNSLPAYWKQQVNYGKAEALLERKWPDKYNAAGHISWEGKIYNDAAFSRRRGLIYQGNMGSALFQSVYQRASSWPTWLPLIPEWYLVILLLGLLSGLGALWKPLLVSVPLFFFSVFAPILLACIGAAQSSIASAPGRLIAGARGHFLVTGLHLIQPLGRLYGRLHYGLTPWRGGRVPGLSSPWPRTLSIWSERWHPPIEWLCSLQAAQRDVGAVVLRGSGYDPWDLEIVEGMLGAVRILLTVEEHGAGRQLIRCRLWPRCSPGGLVIIALFIVLSFEAGLSHAWSASAILGLIALLLALRSLKECIAGMVKAVRAFKKLGEFC